MTRQFSHPKLPKQCFVHVMGNKPAQSIGLVRLGASGYYQVAEPRTAAVTTADEAKALVRELNAEQGVTGLQAECMLVGSMFGWEAPGADPDTYAPETIAALNA